MKFCTIGDRKAVIEDVPVPVPGTKDVLIAMRACGICGTDVEKIAGNYSSRILGHEAVGIVEEVGRDVVGFSEGERVFPHHHVPCYSCHFCRNGSETMCPQFSKSNIHPGGLAEFFVIPDWNISHGGLFRLPSSLSFRTASLIEPLACVIRGLDKLNINSESTVAVIGVGPVGMLQIYALSVLGVKKVVALDISEERCRFARKLGASAAHVSVAAAAQSILGLSEGRGADASVVATGHPQATEAGIAALRRGGRLLQFGLPHPNTALLHDVSDLFTKEILFLNSYSGVERDVEKAIRMLTEHKGNADEIISHSFRLERAPQAFEMAENLREARKVIIEND